MAMQVYPAGSIVRTLLDHFLPYRNMRAVGRGLDGPPRAYTEDEVIGDMERFDYVRIDALRAVPRGRRDWVVILVVSGAGGYSNKGPALRDLLSSVDKERAAKEGRLDEVIVVAEDIFFAKKHVTEVFIEEFRSRSPLGVDPDGHATYYNAYPFDKFACEIPKVKCIPPHRVMSAEEVAETLRALRIEMSDLHVIFTNDPSIVWNGARPKQVVEVTRDSSTACVSINYRRVEQGALTV